MQFLGITRLWINFTDEKLIGYLGRLASLRSFEVECVMEEFEEAQVAIFRKLKVALPKLVVNFEEYLPTIYSDDLMNPVIQFAKIPFKFEWENSNSW